MTADVGASVLSPAQERRLEAAHTALTRFNFQEAYDLYARVRSALPDGGVDVSDPTAARVAMGLALAAQHRTPSTPALIAEAEAIYAALAADAEPALAARALMNIGRLAELSNYLGDPIDLASAREAYQALIDAHGYADIGQEAALRYADTLVQDLADPAGRAKAAAWLEAWIGDQPLGEMAYGSVIAEYLARIEHREGRYAEAVAWFIRADELGLAEPIVAGQIFWTIAKISHERLNDPATARRYYQKIIDEAPRSGLAFEAELELRALDIQASANGGVAR
ncbi:MAG: hypothetical protein AAF823_07775 [Planctomycetota bacterium]